MALTEINFDKLILDKFLRVTGLDRTTSELLFMFDEIQDGNIENTENKVDITGAGGVNIAALKRNKAVTATFNNAYLVMSAMGMQTGSGVVEASEQNKFTVPVVEIVKATSATEVSVTKTPKTGTLKYAYAVNPDGTQGKKYNLAAESPSSNTFTLVDKKLTFAGNTWKQGDPVLVIYDTEVSVGKKISNKGNVNSLDAYLIIDALCRDVCNSNTLYYTKIVIPYASTTGNFTIQTSDTPQPHNFVAESMPDPCGQDKEFWTWYVVE